MRTLSRRFHLGVIGLFVVLLALVLAARSGRGGAQTATGNLAFSPASLTIGPIPAPVDITVANVTDLDGYNVWLTFSSSVQLTGLSDAGLFDNPDASGTPQNLVICLTPTITATTAHLACQILPSELGGADVPVNAAVGATPVPLVRASFVSLSQGVSPLSLAGGGGISVLDVSNVAVNASLGSGSLTAAVSVGGIAEQPDTAALPQHRNNSDRRVTLGGTALLPVALIIFGASLTVWMRRKGAV